MMRGEWCVVFSDEGRAAAESRWGCAATTHHAVQVSRARTYDVTGVVPVPLGVTGNTPDSGSGESWFEPRRGNSKRDATMSRVALLVFPSDCHRFCHRFSRHLFDIMNRDADLTRVAYQRFVFHVRRAH